MQNRPICRAMLAAVLIRLSLSHSIWIYKIHTHMTMWLLLSENVYITRLFHSNIHMTLYTEANTHIHTHARTNTVIDSENGKTKYVFLYAAAVWIRFSIKSNDCRCSYIAYISKSFVRSFFSLFLFLHHYYHLRCRCHRHLLLLLLLSFFVRFCSCVLRLILRLFRFCTTYFFSIRSQYNNIQHHQEEESLHMYNQKKTHSHLSLSLLFTLWAQGRELNLLFA